MSHRRKCGCLIADNRDTLVKKGIEVGGYVKEFCSQHARRTYTLVEMLRAYGGPGSSMDGTMGGDTMLQAAARIEELEKRASWALRIKAAGMPGFIGDMLRGKWEYLDFNLGSFTLREYVEAVEREDKEHEEKAAKKKNRVSRKG